MSIQVYRNQIKTCENNILKFQSDKGRLSVKASTALAKRGTAMTALSKASSPSMANTKRREVERYSNEYNTTQTGIAKLESKISDEQKKLNSAKGKLDDLLAREEKKQQAKREADSKKQLAEQKRMEQAYNQQLRQLNQGLARHEGLHLETAKQIEMLKALPEQITVLFIASDPGEIKLKIDQEVRAITEKIRASEYRDALDFQTRWAARPMDILQAINELKPTIVHFSGHGTSADALVLQDDAGRPKHVSKEGIVSAIAVGSESVRLVFFNTCFSFNQAQSCSEIVDAAIGMNEAIGDDAARVFASQFYSSIGFGHSIGVAFKQAKAALMMEDTNQGDLPELYLNPDLSEEELTLVRPRDIRHSDVG